MATRYSRIMDHSLPILDPSSAFASEVDGSAANDKMATLQEELAHTKNMEMEIGLPAADGVMQEYRHLIGEYFKKMNRETR